MVQWSSPPLAEVIRSINKFSNNLMTRQTLLTLGAERFDVPATVDSGRDVVAEYLMMLGLDNSGLEVANGSGLSRDSRISAALMGRVLQHGYQSQYTAEFVASLPINALAKARLAQLHPAEYTGHAATLATATLTTT